MFKSWHTSSIKVISKDLYISKAACAYTYKLVQKNVVWIN